MISADQDRRIEGLPIGSKPISAPDQSQFPNRIKANFRKRYATHRGSIKSDANNLFYPFSLNYPLYLPPTKANDDGS
jgi:hypothetical protein